MGAAAQRSLTVRSVLAEAVGVYRSNWQRLLALGLMVFVPLGLLSSIAPGDGIEIERFDDLTVIPIIALAIAQIVVPLVGTVFFAGIAAAAVSSGRGHGEHEIRDLARQLPYAKLVAADLLLVIAVGFGLVLLIVPGVVALAWFSLVAPVVEHEGGSVRRAFSRSRELVRGHLWTVALLVWPAMLLQGALEGLGDEVAFAVLGEGFFADWLGSVAGNLLAAPVFALIVVILYLDLREMEAKRF